MHIRPVALQVHVPSISSMHEFSRMAPQPLANGHATTTSTLLRYAPSGYPGSRGWSGPGPATRSKLRLRPAMEAASCPKPSSRLKPYGKPCTAVLQDNWHGKKKHKHASQHYRLPVRCNNPWAAERAESKHDACRSTHTNACATQARSPPERRKARFGAAGRRSGPFVYQIPSKSRSTSTQTVSRNVSQFV